MQETLRDLECDRRTMLRGAGAVAVSGLLAGCGGGGDGGAGGNLPDGISGYLSGANNVDGVADETGSESVTITVGAGNGLAFGPAAVRVGTGTTVTWEWSGNGGGHNVVHEDGEFKSGDNYVAQSGHTYEYTFEETGDYRYYCAPHKTSGMKGAIIVE